MTDLAVTSRCWEMQASASCFELMSVSASYSRCSSSSLAKSISMRPPLPLRTMRTAGAERELELLFGGAGVGVDLARRRRRRRRASFAPHERFGFAHRQAARDDFARDAALRGFVGQREERARVAHRERAGRDFVADFGRQPQQPHVVGDRRAILADGGRDRFLRQLEFVGQPPVGLRFFDRIQIVALDVFDERDLAAADRRRRRARRRGP